MSTQNQPQHGTVAGIPVITFASVVPLDQVGNYSGQLTQGIIAAIVGSGYDGNAKVVTQVVELPGTLPKAPQAPAALPVQATNRARVDVYGPDGNKRTHPVYTGTQGYADLVEKERYVLYTKNGAFALVHPRVDAVGWSPVIAINAAD